MNFDTRIAVVVRQDLLTWQKLNVTAFTISGIAGLPDVLGENYVDGSGTTYLPMIKQPITIFGADHDKNAELRVVGTHPRPQPHPRFTGP